MNLPPARNTSHPPSPDGARKVGCLGCVGMLVGIPLALVVILYLVLFHSPLPLQWASNVIEEDVTPGSTRMELRGVGGSLASGITVKELTFQGDSGDSVIEGLTIRYNGLLDSIRNRQLILEEVSTERSEFVVGSDFLSEKQEDEEGSEEDPADDDAPGSSSEREGEGLKRFELRQLHLENTRFRSLDGKIDFEIPLVRLAGLRIEGDEFDLAELEVVSDGVTLELVDASPEEILGQQVPFSREVRGMILPGFHPLLKKDLPFRLTFGAVDGETASRIILADGAIEQTAVPGGESLVQIHGLTITDYIDTGNHLLPERFTTTVRENDGSVDIGDGEFFLGKTRFEIAGQQFDAEDPQSAILGTAEVAGHGMAARIRPAKDRLWPPLSVEIESTPPLEGAALLSLVYFRQAYEELAPEEKTRIDGLASSLVDSE